MRSALLRGLAVGALLAPTSALVARAQPAAGTPPERTRVDPATGEPSNRGEPGAARSGSSEDPSVQQGERAPDAASAGTGGSGPPPAASDESAAADDIPAGIPVDSPHDTTLEPPTNRPGQGDFVQDVEPPSGTGPTR